MKASALREIVEATSKRFPEKRVQELQAELKDKRPPDLESAARMIARGSILAAEEGVPSPTASERILGLNDLVDVNYLERALFASRSVCRIVLKTIHGRNAGFGTGFMVTPSILMTNHHVLEDADDAGLAVAEFDFELDRFGKPKITTEFRLDPDRFFLNDRPLDFALVAVNPASIDGTSGLHEYGFLFLAPQQATVNRGEFMTIVQHPGGDPKQVALRENKLLETDRPFLRYKSDTAGGSSGAPVFNDSWAVVGLHHSGVPKKDDDGNWLLKDGSVAGPDAEDSDIDWIANEGILMSSIVEFVRAQAPDHEGGREFLATVEGPPNRIFNPDDDSNHRRMPPENRPGIGAAAVPIPGGARVTVPVTLDVTVSGLGGVPVTERGSAPGASRPAPATGPAPEKTKYPIHDEDYDAGNRQGYNPKFLGKKLALPWVHDLDDVATMKNGKHVIPYHNFSLVMHKKRRLALFTAANVDFRKERRKPEPGKKYTRKALGGYGKYDREKWMVDPRISEDFQLSDSFYNNDRKAFDKGHLVRRDAVCWGSTYEEVQFANGDTYHITNCSPQVNSFNQARLNGIWGRLENEVGRQGDDEKFTVFSGPVLKDDDEDFEGKMGDKKVVVKIPRQYWKIIVSGEGNNLHAFAFLLKQDLSSVDFTAEKFQPDAEWRGEMISIPALEQLIGQLRFPDRLVDADQFDTEAGETLIDSHAVEKLTRYAAR